MLNMLPATDGSTTTIRNNITAVEVTTTIRNNIYCKEENP
jgi:hypothetical protein